MSSVACCWTRSYLNGLYSASHTSAFPRPLRNFNYCAMAQSFSRFSKLPPEIRNEIWELAATCPRVIDIYDVQCNALATHTEPHPLFSVCHESRTICFAHNRNELHAVNRKTNLAVNFARDFFIIRDDSDWPTLFLPDGHPLRQLERIAIGLGSAPDLTSLLSKLPRLQELRIFLEELPEQFYPSPASEYRRHCPLHHCDIFPHDYYRLNNVWTLRVECPACRWVEELRDADFPYPERWGHFRVTLDISLPNFPTVQQILHSSNPHVRLVKFEESRYDGDISYVPSPVDLEALGRCETSPAACLIKNSDICTH